MVPTILVIEDDKDIGNFLKDFLVENDYNTHLEERGTLGLEYFRKYEPDLVLLDLGLPDIDGETVCAEMKKDYPEIPVIVLTARASVPDKIKGLNFGADDYI